MVERFRFVVLWLFGSDPALDYSLADDHRWYSYPLEGLGFLGSGYHRARGARSYWPLLCRVKVENHG